ncbi:MAG: class I SAM-dependent methyltransferase [Burkholderiaceae bacterium]|jgi:SAM-dependent methyltransferase|nr:class I SAM-dependent methyltransferase [Pseudomonadota bacterium]MBS0598920.1 class I SAM-dependent methyltransferase [Pseudomonadota bacterium]MCO5117315.1 class I SAM-dependent methyltransferase [Burkholderiaceae bacterium]MCP5217736.1 class I SAM-dependent methyltransferase [Burkholderiaceae bacterium]
MNVVSLEQAQALLQAGQCCLDAGDRAGAAAAWQGARAQPATRLAAHNLIELNGLEGAFAQMFGLNCAIAPQDDIFHFFAGHPTSNNPLRDYLADGWRTLSELLLLLERADQPLVKMNHVLEFASGHGRFTRHLVKAIGPGRVTVSDVVADAVDFARQSFGVQGFVSHAVPEQLAWPRRYDLVFVLSLFSHLPRGSWGRWLAVLWDAVAPGGLLVFSTHGSEAARRAGVALDGEGYFFAPSSESNAIDAQEYGTAFTDEAFVRARVNELAPAPVQVDRAPVWFWNHQDAWVLKKQGP